MLTNKYIKSYAVIKSKWISDNLLDEYLPFVMTIIKEKNMVDIDESVLSEEINKKYGLSLQPTMLRQVLSHAMSKNIITQVREQYVANMSQLDKYIIPENDFDELWESLISDFIAYAFTLNMVFSKNEVETNIAKFVDVYDDHNVQRGRIEICTRNNFKQRRNNQQPKN